MRTSVMAAVGAAALTLAGVAGVVAQETPAPSATATPPSATTGATVVPKAAGDMAAADYATTQAATDWRSSKVIGLNVYNAANEKIGDINDLIIGSSGAITHAVVGVGGFLGIGEKNVAVPFSSVKMSRDKDGKPTAMVDTTKDALTAAPAFKFYSSNS